MKSPGLSSLRTAGGAPSASPSAAAPDRAPGRTGLPLGRRARFAHRALAVALAALAGLIVLQSVVAVVRYRDVFPFYDMVLVDYRYLFASARAFWIFHDNEHLPLAAMPLFWADLSLFGGQGLFLVLCNLALAAAIAAAPWPALRAATPGRPVLAAMGAALAACLLFWLGNRTNLTWPKQTHMYLSLFALMPAFGRAASERPVGVAAAAAISAWLALATFSFGYGIIGFPCVGVIAVMRRWDWRALLVLAAALAACLTVYLGLTGGLGYYVSEGAPLLGRRIGSGVSYALMFVAAPLVAALRPVLAEADARTAGAVVAAAGLAVFAWRGWVGLRRRPDRLEAWALLLALFTLGNAAETAFARAARFGIEGALEYRYILGELPFWVALVLLAVRSLVRAPARAVLAAGVAALALEAGVLASQQAELRSLRDETALRWRAAMAALVHVDDRAFYESRIWPAADQVAAVVDGFRARRLSMFAWPEAAWLGRGIGSFDPVSGTCLGTIDVATPMPGTPGRLVEGWFDDKRVPFAAGWVLLTEPGGRVVGLAHGGQPRPNLVAARRQGRLRYAGWLGYTSPEAAGLSQAELAAYLVLPNGRACRLAPDDPPR